LASPIGSRDLPVLRPARAIAPLADRLGVALGYAGALAGGTLLVRTRPAATRQAWLGWASTNLVNLRYHPFGAMVASAFVSTDDTVGWIALAVIGLGVTGWVLGSWRTALLVATSHMLATLISEGILAYRIHAGVAPDDQRLLLDVGPSYIVVCALTAGMVYGWWVGRGWCALALGFVAPSIFGWLGEWEVSSIGHVCSVVIGLVLGWPLLRSARRAAGFGST
jgi:hypothetical protein